MHSYPIFDLHCDLLGCLEENPDLNFLSPETNCSLAQISTAGIELQVLALFTMTKKNSSKIGKRQKDLYTKLLKQHPDKAAPFKDFSLSSHKTHFLFAIENASTLIEKDEPLDFLFQRFEEYEKLERILYVSLTWNQENRFGGGNETDIGLKSDGKSLLEYLHSKNIAVDLSHTSDRLAFDILNYIDRKALQVPVIASHSNYRAVKNVPRNLPDILVQEIIKRDGVIGLNFVKRFIGETEESFFEHIEHGHLLGAENHMCLGADFYGALNIPNDVCPGQDPFPFFYPFSNSSCYPQFLDFLRKRFSEEWIEKLAYKNLYRYIEKFQSISSEKKHEEELRNT